MESIFCRKTVPLSLSLDGWIDDSTKNAASEGNDADSSQGPYSGHRACYVLTVEVTPPIILLLSLTARAI